MTSLPFWQEYGRDHRSNFACEHGLLDTRPPIIPSALLVRLPDPINLGYSPVQMPLDCPAPPIYLTAISLPRYFSIFITAFHYYVRLVSQFCTRFTIFVCTDFTCFTFVNRINNRYYCSLPKKHLLFRLNNVNIYRASMTTKSLRTHGSRSQIKLGSRS